jgi:hypothetical protein
LQATERRTIGARVLLHLPIYHTYRRPVHRHRRTVSHRIYGCK